MTVSRAQATVYLVALPGWLVSFVLVALLGEVDGPPDPFIGALGPATFICVSVIGAVAVMRVQRREVAAEREGVLGPILAEFILMSIGARVPLAVASLRARSLK
jgi:hypothetical protein